MLEDYSIKALDYLFLTRPVLLFPIWTVLLAGFIKAQTTMSGGFVENWKAIQGGLTSSNFWLSFSGLTLLMAAVFIINQFTDAQSDRLNNKLFILADGMVSKKAATYEIMTLVVLAFAVAFQINTNFIALSVLLFLVTGVFYSLPPLLWKDRPIAGLLVNLVGGLLTFLIGWQIVSELSWQAPQNAVPYLFAVGAVYFLTTIPDSAGDATVGKITFAVRFGNGPTILAALILELACVAAAIVLQDYLILFPALAALPFFISLTFQDDNAKIILAARLAILFLSVSVVVHFPVYALLMVSVYILSKWYYRRRFQLDYPSLYPVVERLYDQN